MLAFNGPVQGQLGRPLNDPLTDTNVETMLLHTQMHSSIYTVSQEVQMRAVVKKWGNSASVRIPASVMVAAGLRLDQAVEVREDNGRIVIEPIESEDYDLAQLLAAITPENTHENVDFGMPIGKEVL